MNEVNALSKPLTSFEVSFRANLQQHIAVMNQVMRLKASDATQLPALAQQLSTLDNSMSTLIDSSTLRAAPPSASAAVCTPGSARQRRPWSDIEFAPLSVEEANA